MENVVLTVHLILAVLLIGVVLLQRSEGGGLGMGGGGGGGGVMTGRQAANALSRLTWIFAIAFIITSMTLTLIAARNASSSSLVDQLNLGGSQQAPATSLPGIGDYAPPPGAGQPVVPGAGQPVAPPAAAPAAETPAPAAAVPVTPPASTPAPDAPAPEAPAPAAN
ncbi:preprotein translocase subunit SecG [Paracoccus thiocyanatus]|uniref:Protein-export membrane protein SecG n=1 Tax=Paracoccus thiocyanatus TaxID=34006 RepID=A0A3D8PC68_9RHOB|nr:preprotein translocase subunit SecG [Paracoccus thiocyanatus]RDW13232.1 preprotein translocase subunit SecG [Paracoccus thiocyanatus]